MNNKFYEDVSEPRQKKPFKSPHSFTYFYNLSRFRLTNSLVKTYYSPGRKIVNIGPTTDWNANDLEVTPIHLKKKTFSDDEPKGCILNDCHFEVEHIDLPDAWADIIVVIDSFEHIVDLDSLICEIKRIMTPEGVFIVSVPSDKFLTVQHILSLLQKLFNKCFKRNKSTQRHCCHVQNFSQSALKQRLGSYGLLIDIIFSNKLFNYFLVARKNEELINLSFLDLTVILPTKNEAINIRNVIEQLRVTYPHVQIIAADDASTDGTADIIRDLQSQGNLAFVDRRHQKIQGLTASILDAVDCVTTPYFIVMDADCQHDVKYVNHIYNQLKLDCKFCVASRASIPYGSLIRRLITLVGSFMGRVILRLQKKNPPHDILSGFFGAETEYWHKVVSGHKDRFSKRGYKIVFDFLVLEDNLSHIENIYYEFKQRPSGHSKIGYKVYREFLKSLWRGLRQIKQC